MHFSRFCMVVLLGLTALLVSCTIGPPAATNSVEKQSYGKSVTITAAQTCPSGFPLKCGTWCCPNGTQCDASGPENQKCSVTSQTLNQPDSGTPPETEPPPPVCPADAPIDCDLFCCPSGTQCDPNGPEHQKCRLVNVPPPTPCFDDSDCTATQICVLTEKNTAECADLCQSDTDCKGQCCYATDDPKVGACGPCP